MRAGTLGPVKFEDYTWSTNPITHNIRNVYYNISIKDSTEGIRENITALEEKNMKNNQDFLKKLNDNIENPDWKKWKMGENGYPKLE